MGKSKKGKARTSGGQDCPITADPRVRLASEEQTKSIAANFPNGMSQPSLRALYAAGIRTLKQLSTITEKQLAELHGMGPKGVRILKAAMEAANIQFRSAQK